MLCAALCASLLAWADAPARQHPPQAAEPLANTVAADGPEGGAARGEIEGVVEGESGKPLVNATVVARPVGKGIAPALVSTDAEGRFRLTGLAPAAYRLHAFAPGYVNAAVSPSGGPASDYYRPGDTATLRLFKGGVITGVVTDASGAPLAAVRVRAARVPDGGGAAAFARDASTDDRGVYRVYGLEAGAYLVSVSGSGLFQPNPNFKAGGQPTFYPSSPRGGATKVSVTAGQEVVGINIQRRELGGFSVSGSVEGATSKGVGVALLDAATGEILETASLPVGERAFAFHSVPDGEYELVARGGGEAGEASVSAPRRVAMRGRDLSGVVLALRRTVTLTGRIILEPSAPAGQGEACAGVQPAGVREAVVSLRREEQPGAGADARTGGQSVMETAPDADGAFTFSALPPGRYDLNLSHPGRGTFLRAIAVGAGAPGRQSVAEAAGGSLTLTEGAGAERLTVVLGEGAAELRGQVRADAGATPPAALLVYLVPAAHVDDPLRFAGTPVSGDGAFVFEHIAPGSYHLVAVSSDGARPRLADAATRARLRREAEAAGAAVSLQPCQRVEGFELPYAARVR